MVIEMNSIGGRVQKVLAGAPAGRLTLGKLLSETNQEPLAPEPVFLDFARIEVATASFLRESVLRFRDAVRNHNSNFYPVVANANDQVKEELALLLQGGGDAIMTCSIDDQGTSNPALIGNLDPKQNLTFELVNRLGETDASDLMNRYGSAENVKQTAWNNRLASLASLGLVFELTQGRAKRYKRLFDGVGHGD